MRAALSGVIRVVFTRRSATAVRLRTGWPVAVERFARAVHRFSDRIEVIPDRALRSELRTLGEELESALNDVRPTSRGRHFRGVDNAAAVRAVLRAGTLCAQATEAAVLAAAASRNRQADEVGRQVEVVRALADTISELTGACTTPDD